MSYGCGGLGSSKRSMKYLSKILHEENANFLLIYYKGPFIYYVITFLGFLDPPPPYVSMFLVLRISKDWHFLTPLPPKSADVLHEWSLEHYRISSYVSKETFHNLKCVCSYLSRNIRPVQLEHTL